MLEQTYRVSGTPVSIRMPRTAEDFDQFENWLALTPGILALDTETTGLNIWAAGFKCRLVQLGTATEAWVLDVDRFHPRIRAALARTERQYVLHNAPYDLLVLDHAGLAPLAGLSPRCHDTYLLAHLLDPRGPQDGGIGLGLKALSVRHVDEQAADTAAGLTEVFRRDYRATKATGWALIDLEHPTYWLYAGLDVIYTSRLLRAVGPIVRQQGLTELARFEHTVQRLTTRLQHRGLLIDVEYAQRLRQRLRSEHQEWQAVAADFNVDKVGSTAQVTAALLAMGETWTERTPKGAPSVGKTVLARMADIDVRDWTRLHVREPNPLAEAVVRAKRAAKWGTAYAQPFLTDRDAGDRIHPGIKSLAARTGRMSISNPPLQQLPASDHTIRTAIIADPGQSIIAADYSSVEMRVMAALADVAAMKTAIREGQDLHDFTAQLLYGPGFTKGERKLAKIVGLGKIFGGGARGLSTQSGAPFEQVQAAVDRYEAVYPEVRRYADTLSREAYNRGGYVVAPIGRRMILDEHRFYAATNYVVQGTARDILARALVRIDEAGLMEHVLIPVHDEFVMQAPKGEEEGVLRAMKALMDTELNGVPITCETAVSGANWGVRYQKP